MCLLGEAWRWARLGQEPKARKKEGISWPDFSDLHQGFENCFKISCLK